jgi:hypothetical protein
MRSDRKKERGPGYEEGSRQQVLISINELMEGASADDQVIDVTLQPDALPNESGDGRAAMKHCRQSLSRSPSAEAAIDERCE